MRVVATLLSLLGVLMWCAGQTHAAAAATARGANGNAPWTPAEILALCDGTDNLPCEKNVDPRAYIPCRDQRCHKPVQDFRSVNACGRPRPGKDELRGPVNLERLRVKNPGKQRGGHTRQEL